MPDLRCHFDTHVNFYHLTRTLRACVVLAENLLYGQIPDVLSSMPNMVVFSAFRSEKSGPRLSGYLPPFHRSPQLTDLYLQGNEIQGSIPPNFLSASLSAELIKLGNNLLTGEVPADLETIPGLTIQLEGNELTGFPKTFCDKADWMGGNIGTYGCNAFLCPPGTASPRGRIVDETSECSNCTRPENAPYYGTTSCEGPPDEREILMSFFYEMNGEDWFRNDFWGTTADYCDWYGIACMNGKVVEINLRANNLEGVPPPELFYLRELQILWLFSNPMSFSFENIGNARNLQDLRLDSTHLHSLHGVGSARSLISLDVRFTHVKGAFPKDILQLTNLRTLSMGGNSLTGTLPDSFSPLRFLYSLRLESNQLTGRLPSFDDMHFLRHLDISKNALTGQISKKIFDKVDSSEHVILNLAENQITDVVPEEMDRFEHVDIYLRDNRILGMPLLLCDNSNWNGGDVGDHGCNGILCKPGSYNEYGRRRTGYPCKECPTATYHGQTTCPPRSSGNRLSVVFGLKLLVGAALSWHMLVY